MIKSIAKIKQSETLPDESEIGSPSDINISKPNSIETRNKVRSILRQKFGKYPINSYLILKLKE